MSDLSYSVDQLSSLSAHLGALKHNLTTTDGHADYRLDTLGHQRVVSAMEDFRGNWDDNRDHLADKLGTLGNLAGKAAEGFSQADADLARKIRAALERG
ncbi:MAG: hypothetical protein ACXVWU_00975 [Nocardioides sp.]